MNKRTIASAALVALGLSACAAQPKVSQPVTAMRVDRVACAPTFLLARAEDDVCTVFRHADTHRIEVGPASDTVPADEVLSAGDVWNVPCAQGDAFHWMERDTDGTLREYSESCPQPLDK